MRSGAPKTSACGCGDFPRPSSDIFTSHTIHPHWAFQYGGRPELQFNIGLERVSDADELRHGVAFSFEPSQSLPSIDVLIQKVRLFNDFMHMRMWHHASRERSADYAPSPCACRKSNPDILVVQSAEN